MSHNGQSKRAKQVITQRLVLKLVRKALPPATRVFRDTRRRRNKRIELE